MKMMLRRRFLTRVGPLICGFVVGAIAAVWSLQALLSQFDEARDQSQRLAQGVEQISATIRTASDASPEVFLDQFATAVAQINATAQAIGDPVVLAKAAPLEALVGEIGADPVTNFANSERLAEARVLTRDLEVAVLNHIFDSHSAITGRMRLLILALTIAALIMVNVAVFVLLRTAQMVLKPVNTLVSYSRELAAERFDRRVDVDRDDEFGELARAYNHAAEELERSEERKAEAIRQLAVTLNHSLNNAMSIIEMQLGLIDRESSGDPLLTSHLRQIRTTLLDMSKTVASLHNIRRVVLTDYAAGQQMVDLEASVAEELPGAAGGVEQLDRLRQREPDAVHDEKMVAMGRMTAGIAHEIANPLAAMDSILQLMQRRPDKPRPESVKTLRELVAQILGVVRQLTRHAHPGDGADEVVSLDDVVRASLDLLVFSRQSTIVHASYGLEDGAGMVFLNAQAIRQVLANLIVNALDATEGVADPRIDVRTFRDGRWCVVEVEDNGAGIKPEHLPHIFEPFYTTKPVGQGTGLGLSICERLVKEQNGEIGVRSVPGEGAVFTIRLHATESESASSRSSTASVEPPRVRAEPDGGGASESPGAGGSMGELEVQQTRQIGARR